MFNLIVESIKKRWDEWNIPGVILLSLSLQTILILMAPLRKGTGNKLIIFLIWSAYLLADWAANFGIGLIAQNASNIPTNQQADGNKKNNNELVAFWAPFLLLHLGGPDTITAFALEDNELWLRHLLGLTFQTVAAVYIFILSIPGTKLLFPTMLMFVAGIFKYFERTRALYLASLERLRNSMLKKPNPGPNYAKLMENKDSNEQVNIRTGRSVILLPAVQTGNIENRLDYLEVMNNAYQYFNLFKGLIVDLNYTFQELYSKRASFTKFSSEDALRIIEVELNFVYEVFHTKIQVTHSKMGIILRFICFCSVVVALSIFHFHVEKHGFNDFDVGVTYTLFLGAMALDIVAFVMLVFSDQTFIALRDGNHESRLGKIKTRIAAALRWCLVLKNPLWRECHVQHSHPGIKHQVLETPFLFRRWSGSVSGHSLMRYWLKAHPSKVHKAETCLHRTCESVIHYLGIDKIFQKIVNTTTKSIQFLHIYQIIGLLGSVAALLGLTDIADEMRIKTSLSHEPLTKELWVFIFNEIKRKSETAASPGELKRLCSAKGDWILEQWNSKDVRVEVPGYDIANVAYDEAILLWHIATELLYYTTQESVDVKTCNAREFSKLLSDYMLYIIVSKPMMIDAMAVSVKTRLQDTNAEAIRFFKEKSMKPNEVKEACESILKVDTSLPPTPSSVKGDKTKSVLFDACMLARELQKLVEENQWELVSQVWVELLSYAACHCRPWTHAQQVSNGGELLTFVWLLMAHFGLAEQFEISFLDARTLFVTP